MKWLIIVAVLYVVCGIVSYGLMFYYYQTRFKCFAWPGRWWHRSASLAAAVCGPIGFIHRIIVSAGDTDRTPWRLRFSIVPPEESWNDYHRRWPSLPRTQWENYHI